MDNDHQRRQCTESRVQQAQAYAKKMIEDTMAKAEIIEKEARSKAEAAALRKSPSNSESDNELGGEYVPSTAAHWISVASSMVVRRSFWIKIEGSSH